MTTTTPPHLRKLRGRIAEAGLRRQDLAALLGYSETMFSLYLNGRRPEPPDFEANVYAAIDRLEAAEKAAGEARERVLAESADEDIDIDEYRRPAPDATKAAEEARERVLAEGGE